MSVSEIMDYILEVLSMPFSYLLNPGKRVFYVYLITSAILALFAYQRIKKKEGFFKYLIKKEMWWGRSAKIDYALIFFNSLVKVLLIAPFLGLTVFIAVELNSWMLEAFEKSTISWSLSTWILLYTFAIIIVNDFASFFIHYLMHKVPFLWRFHKIHHSATTLTPFTQYRIHPVELIVNNFRGIIVKGIITGLFMYWANNEISMYTILGVNILNFLFLFLGANLRHSHIQLKYFKFLEYILISPYQHQIHHSNNPKHYDTNIGSRFAFWDWMFGTLITSDKAVNIKFGLGEEDKDYQSFRQNLIRPFSNKN